MLAAVDGRAHIPFMATTSRKASRTAALSKTERTVVYRGIKIAPIAGKRSETAITLREALKGEAGPSHDRPAND